MATIELDPTSQPGGALREAIEAALQSSGSAVVVLRRGAAGGLHHFTFPAPGMQFQVGATGLRLLAAHEPALEATAARPIVQRPPNSIVPPKTDANYGLFFVPKAPDPAEVAGVKKWIQHPGNDGIFEFAVVVRGSVEVKGLMFDCNMGNQLELDELPKEKIEHSAMLGFSGAKYRVRKKDPENGLPERRIYVAFKSIIIDDVIFENGGFADDLLFQDADFHPNIKAVALNRVVSRNRVNGRRASVQFTGLAQTVAIDEVEVESFKLEKTGNWREQPRTALKLTRSIWKIEGLRVRRVSFSAGGDVYKLLGQSLDVSEKFHLDWARGTISSSALAVPQEAEDRSMTRLRDFRFQGVHWRLSPRADGTLGGLRPMALNGTDSEVRFINNTFTVNNEGAAPVAGQIFETVKHGNAQGFVKVRATGCVYPSDFGQTDAPARPIAWIRAPGEWLFAKADLGDRSIASAFDLDPIHAQTVETAAKVTISVD